MKWNIVLDSSCDLTKDEQKGDVGIDIVPLSILVGDKSFTDNDEIDTKALLKAMVEEKEASSTACPSPDDFCKAFLKAENSICITLTGELSGTFNSASLGKEMALEENPNLNIHLIDSKATAGKMVLIKEKALELIEQGLEFDEICSSLDAYNNDTHLVFALGGYDNLIKTGRMSKISGIMATALGIRAVATAKDGKIEVAKKPRGEKNAVEAMIEIMNSTKNLSGKNVVISHCENLSGAEYMKEQILNRLGAKAVRIIKCKGLTSFYTMEKGLIVGY